ncbi:NAD-dependent epimerase/dehydratase family protein [Neobacillus sp. LXY-1]|uniref:NAD-dependent epimerase/dehydratase family protein n=1 Tax=Neobacillus sp. LXY-1 TaxID=3379133 RepID=UPI003EDF9228
MKVLILGGTRFFGKKLVEQFVQEKADITIVTRGNTPDLFGNTVKHLKADRTDLAALKNALGSSAYDVVYDNICYGPKEEEEAVTLFTGRTSKYILTSSLSVYDFGGPAKKEMDFDPYAFNISVPFPTHYDYAEGKRLAESVLFQKASFPCTAVRFPIVLGHDDYTRRLHFHIEQIQKGVPLVIPNTDAKISFIHSDEAAAFLYFLGHSDLEGPINASSNGVYSLSQLVGLIERVVGKKARIESETDANDMSPFGIPETWVMDTTKARNGGFSFSHLDSWLPGLIEEITAQSNDR